MPPARPPTGSISFIFAYVFAEKCIHRRLAPPQWEILDLPLIEVKSIGYSLNIHEYDPILPIFDYMASKSQSNSFKIGSFSLQEFESSNVDGENLAVKSDENLEK